MVVLREMVQQAVEFARRHQGSDGAWRIPPEPRILENALVVYALQRLNLASQPVAQALRWLEACPAPTPAAANASSFVESIERWLLQSALRAAPASIDVFPERPEHPQAGRRLRLLRALAAEAGLIGGAALSDLRAELAVGLSSIDEAKPWSAAEDAALYIISSEPQSELTATALGIVVRARASDGSVAGNPISTVLALWAATRADATGLAASLLDALLSLRFDGTWRFCTTEVWDTALLTRSLLLSRAGADSVQAARGFLRRVQCTDGGWGYACGRDSDVDTSAMGLLVTERNEPGWERARAYLLGRRNGDGLWRTWHDKRDSVAPDVVAHAVVALHGGGKGDALTAGARGFLADRFEASGGWRADWYDNRHYAAYEIGKALPEHPYTAQAVASLRAQQNDDGGFSPSSSSPSTAAATGCALAMLAEHVEVGNPTLLRALDYLVLNANAQGSWPGPTGMYGPRPFLSDYAMQTHALCLLGAASVLHLWTSALQCPHQGQLLPSMVEDAP